MWHLSHTCVQLYVLICSNYIIIVKNNNSDSVNSKNLVERLGPYERQNICTDVYTVVMCKCNNCVVSRLHCNSVIWFSLI